jgi:hypothetical protein
LRARGKCLQMTDLRMDLSPESGKELLDFNKKTKNPVKT